MTEKWPFLRLVLARFSERNNVVHVAADVDLSKLDDYMKTYVLTLSKVFPKAHARAGEPTEFREKFLSSEKIHTIRASYSLWKKRIKEVQEGNAVLSIRQWTGMSYYSKQVEIARLTADDGVGIQKLELTNDPSECIIEDHRYSYVFIAKNDGWGADDWITWFSCHVPSKPMAIIHFTKFRY